MTGVQTCALPISVIPLYEAGYPRVTHPSATQSNISSSEESKISASFDLHVLGTPPAFILSQDQTLMLKFSPGQKSLLAISFPFTVINRFCSLNNSLKNFQGFFSTVQLSRFAVHLSDATLTFYHVRSCLSTTFLTFLKVFCCFLFSNSLSLETA